MLNIWRSMIRQQGDVLEYWEALKAYNLPRTFFNSAFSLALLARSCAFDG